MAKQDDTMPCSRKSCKGTMTYHQKLTANANVEPPVQPSGMVGTRPDPDYAGWLCDADASHVDWDRP